MATGKKGKRILRRETSGSTIDKFFVSLVRCLWNSLSLLIHREIPISKRYLRATIRRKKRAIDRISFSRAILQLEEGGIRPTARRFEGIRGASRISCLKAREGRNAAVVLRYLRRIGDLDFLSSSRLYPFSLILFIPTTFIHNFSRHYYPASSIEALVCHGFNPMLDIRIFSLHILVP